jgi:hypothetical protein
MEKPRMSANNSTPPGDSAEGGEQQATKCYANFHMCPEEYALWSVSRRLSRKTGILYFDGRKFAKYFEDTGKDRVYRAARGLWRKGWFELIAPAVRDKRTGLFSSTQYRVLSEEEWATLNPHVCVPAVDAEQWMKDLAQPSPEDATGTGPQNETGEADDQSLKPEQPVPITRMTSPQNATYSLEENYVKENTEEEKSASTGLENGTGDKVSAGVFAVEKKSAAWKKAAWDMASDAWKFKFKESPNWTKKDRADLNDFCDRKPDLTFPEFVRRWAFYLKSTDEFYAKQGYSLSYFCNKAFDALRDGPQNIRQQAEANPETPWGALGLTLQEYRDIQNGKYKSAADCKAQRSAVP